LETFVKKDIAHIVSENTGFFIAIDILRLICCDSLGTILAFPIGNTAISLIW